MYESFWRELLRVLNHLYDPYELATSPLVRLFGLEHEENPASSLRRLLIDGITALRPDASVPVNSNSWRFYLLLTHRYLEQASQSQAANDLSLSIRHLRRQEKLAVQVLAQLLWKRHGLQASWDALGQWMPSTISEEEATNVSAPTPEEELKKLGRAVSSEVIDVSEVIHSVIEVVSPLLAESNIKIVSQLADGLYVAGRPPVIRQALLCTLTAFVEVATRSTVSIQTELDDQRVHIHVHSIPDDPWVSYRDEVSPDQIKMARELVELSGGSFTMTKQPRLFAIELIFPAHSVIPVLAIDDNQDTLRLFQRYLQHTKYRLIGLQDPAQVFALAKEVSPSILLMDIMLPGIDGWELLRQLRDHPDTRRIPTIVCTILLEERLALALGATAFLRKPVSRTAFISLLEQHVVPQEREFD